MGCARGELAACHGALRWDEELGALDSFPAATPAHTLAHVRWATGVMVCTWISS